MMAELLVRAIDKINHSDPYLDAKCTKRGDVICVQPDGWVWGKMELLDPQYRVLKFPGVPVADMQSLLVPELDTDIQNPSMVLQRRAFKVDLDHPTFAASRTVLDDGLRRKRAHRINMDGAELLNTRVQKPALVDPNVLE